MKNTLETHWAHLEAITTWAAAEAFAEGRRLYQAKIKRETTRSNIVRRGKARNAFGKLEWNACEHFDRLTALPKLVMRLAMAFVELESAFYKGESARKRHNKIDTEAYPAAQNRMLRQIEQRDKRIRQLTDERDEAREAMSSVKAQLILAESQIEQLQQDQKPKTRSRKKK